MSPLIFGVAWSYEYSGTAWKPLPRASAFGAHVDVSHHSLPRPCPRLKPVEVAKERVCRRVGCGRSGSDHGPP